MTTSKFRWDRSARAVLDDAVARIGPNHCVVEFRGDAVVLAETPGGDYRDRAAIGRLIDCGTVLSTAWTALRALGQEPLIVFPRDLARPDEVAVVRCTGVRPPTPEEERRYVALRQLRHCRDDAELTPVGNAVLGVVAAENIWAGTQVHLIRPEWVPTLHTLGADLTGQSPLLITTPGDTRRDHVLAGAAMHGLCLAASVRDLVAQLIPMPGPVPSARPRLLDAAVIRGVPQVVVRIGRLEPQRRKP